MKIFGLNNEKVDAQESVSLNQFNLFSREVDAEQFRDIASTIKRGWKFQETGGVLAWQS
jgi:hypothetical protein